LAVDGRREALAELARGPVLGVSVEVVDHQEEGRAPVALDPGRGRVRRLRGVAQLLVALVGARVEVLEAARDAEGPREEVDVHDRRGVVARLAEAVRQRRDRRVETVVGVRAAARAVGLRRLRGEQRSEGGQGPGRVREGVRARRPLRRQRVEPRRQAALVPVGAQSVGAQRVDDDQDDVGPRRCRGSAPPAARPEEEESQEPQARDDPGPPRDARRARVRGARNARAQLQKGTVTASE
jgi:hypothetical protein